jgi:hypothetical protein
MDAELAISIVAPLSQADAPCLLIFGALPQLAFGQPVSTELRASPSGPLGSEPVGVRRVQDLGPQPQGEGRRPSPWLAQTLDPARLPGTLTDLATAQAAEPSPEAQNLRDEIQTCARQLSQYRATLDNGGDPAVVGQWITETQARKLAAEARLTAAEGTKAAPRRMTKEEIQALS